MQHPNDIVLRQTPGRDATASEIARNRGEFRRRPHVSDEPVAAATAPVTTAPRPVRETPAAGQKDYGRARLYH